MSDRTRTLVREYLAGKLHTNAFGDGDRLFSTGRIDSLAAVKLVLFLEERFGLDAGDPDFDPSMLDSVNEIVMLLADQGRA